MRMQSIELQPVKSIPTNKSIENGHLIAFVSLGNQTFDVVSNPIVCLDNADPRALFDQIDSEFDASITKNDTLTITVYFQDQDSLKGKKFKKLRHMVQNFMHKKKPTENSLYPVPSTLSTLSTVSTRTTGRHSEVLIGKTDFSIRQVVSVNYFLERFLKWMYDSMKMMDQGTQNNVLLCSKFRCGRVWLSKKNS